MERKKGFTLSETLITLAVLGIIIAATIPTLINTTNKHNYVNGLKKAYLILKTATSQLMADNSGTMINMVATNDAGTLLNKYCSKLNCVQVCASLTPGCFSNSTAAKNLYGDNFWFDATNSSNIASAILSNGMLLSVTADDFSGTASLVGSVWVDVNGFKPPNTAGRDIFGFLLTTNSIVPYGTIKDTTYNNLNTYCSPSSNDTQSGKSCSGRILTEGAMNY